MFEQEQEPTETPPVGLRRSKRSKFHLDVVAILNGSQERRRHASDGTQNSSRCFNRRSSKNRAPKNSASPLIDAPLLSPEIPVLEPMNVSNDLENQKTTNEPLTVEIEQNESVDITAPLSKKRSPKEFVAMDDSTANSMKDGLKRSKSRSSSSATPKTSSPLPEVTITKPPNPDLICPTCNNELKSRAGYVSHVKACEKNGGKWKSRPKKQVVEELEDDEWMADISESANSSRGAALRRSTNMSMRSADSNGLLMTVKNEVEYLYETSGDIDQLNDSGDGDDLMPVLVPECTLEPSRNSTPLGTRKRAGNASLQKEFRPNDRKVRRPKLISTTHSSLDLPFDIKSAVNQRLQLPPVPQIIVDPPTDRNATEFNCNECPYKASDSNLLALHRILHRGDRPYRCQSCSYNCFSAEALHSHLDLHVPPLSPNSAAMMRKRIAANKRHTVTEFVPPNAPNVISCNQCNFRTLQHDRIVQHRLEHIQTQRQRLVCIIKRSMNDETNHNRAKSRLPQPTAKMYDCKKCGFRVEHKEHLTHHEELHGSGLLYACRHCDYASDAASVRDYHQRHHHFELSLTTYAKNLAVEILKRKANEVLRNPSQTTSASTETTEELADSDTQDRVDDQIEDSAVSSTISSDDVYKQFVPAECR
ncbi:Zinc finger, C2H2 type [Aphelenchoides besseyi]|nr:Zinc finger, C2H2 type [Aphelenchoides besseyi]